MSHYTPPLPVPVTCNIFRFNYCEQHRLSRWFPIISTIVSHSNYSVLICCGRKVWTRFSVSCLDKMKFKCSFKPTVTFLDDAFWYCRAVSLTGCREAVKLWDCLQSFFEKRGCFTCSLSPGYSGTKGITIFEEKKTKWRRGRVLKSEVKQECDAPLILFLFFVGNKVGSLSWRRCMVVVEAPEPGAPTLKALPLISRPRSWQETGKFTQWRALQCWWELFSTFICVNLYRRDLTQCKTGFLSARSETYLVIGTTRCFHSTEISVSRANWDCHSCILLTMVARLPVVNINTTGKFQVGEVEKLSFST